MNQRHHYYETVNKVMSLGMDKKPVLGKGKPEGMGQ
jgi:hypothetical protein